MTKARKTPTTSAQHRIEVTPLQGGRYRAEIPALKVSVEGAGREEAIQLARMGALQAGVKSWRPILANFLLDSVVAAWVSVNEMKVRRNDLPVELRGVKVGRDLADIREHHAVVLFERVAIGAGVQSTFNMAPVGPTGDGSAWGVQVLTHGAVAVRTAAAELTAIPDLTSLGKSTLAAMGDLVSRAMRRAVLLEQLELTMWNLAFCSDRLRLGGSANVLRAIRDLGLTKEYEHAKRIGLVQTGRRKRELKASGDRKNRP